MAESESRVTPQPDITGVAREPTGGVQGGIYFVGLLISHKELKMFRPLLHAETSKSVIGGRGKTALVCALGLSMLGLSPATAATKQAAAPDASSPAVALNWCTVVPLQPVYYSPSVTYKRIRYDVRVNCSRGSAEILDYQYETRYSPWDLLALQRIPSGGTVGTGRYSSYGFVPDTQVGYERLQHRTMYRVHSGNSVTGWSALTTSTALIVYNN